MLEKFKSWLLSVGALAVDKLLPAVIILSIGILAIRTVMSIINKALENS